MAIAFAPFSDDDVEPEGQAHPGLVVLLALATIGLLAWLMLIDKPPPKVAVAVETRAGALADPRLTMARIQSNLERVAARTRPWPLAKGAKADPLEALVDAYAALLKGRERRFDAALAKVEAAVEARLPRPELAADDAEREQLVARHQAMTAYFAGLDAQGSAHAPPLARFIRAMRKADAVLFAEIAGGRPAAIDTRRAEGSAAASGLWLRLPCRTALGRADELARLAKAFGPLAGPLLNCPSDERDVTRLAALAAAPARLLTAREVPPPPVRAAEPPPAPPEEMEGDGNADAEAEPAPEPVAVDPDAALTPLMKAARAGDAAAIERLLAEGAEVNAQSWDEAATPDLEADGRSALMFAAASGSAAALQALLAARADPFQADSKGRRAIDYLLGYGSQPPAKRLDPAALQPLLRRLY
ncbi:ankyrin repeat domain-containing protein [Magnetospirillum sp. UT-4]|uniref:ankyrin repeat domain-containing protein n=1 Tax=Magnetospirillum sp. UT-4 TaxID=2681467 RepID=UPI001381E034|nr:ankyrin repeat domain-containing protein [Magnetospirillum sp. UT-4]CAA7624315.1 hypothetical protein MTBUT4_60009 [Magnetospirillum sp. UT-4]